MPLANLGKGLNFMVRLRYKEPKRRKQYQPNIKLEEILLRMNRLLAPLEREEVHKLPKSHLPVLFLCYAPRSGSTILSQLLARTGCFNYVSNFLARYWLAPYVGGLLERELKLRRDYGNISLESEFGVTKAFMDPHEFGFFWNQWLPVKNLTVLTLQELKKIDIKSLQREINALKALSDKPFFFKSGIAGMNAGFLAKNIPHSRFIVIKRKYPYIAQSLYQSRQKFYGSEKHWWSIKPTRYKTLYKKDVYDQISGQVVEIYRDIEQQLKGRAHMTFWYEDICAHPHRILRNIFDFLSVSPPPHWDQFIPSKLKNNNQIKISKETFKKLTDSLHAYLKKCGVDAKNCI